MRCKQVSCGYGSLIVGEISVDGETFFAQGHSAKEFIECVNDAIYATFETPVKYADALGYGRLKPSSAELASLNNQAVKKDH